MPYGFSLGYQLRNKVGTILLKKVAGSNVKKLSNVLQGSRLAIGILAHVSMGLLGQCVIVYYFFIDLFDFHFLIIITFHLFIYF